MDGFGDEQVKRITFFASRTSEPKCDRLDVDYLG
jgi:hypothetical protein